MEYATDMSTRQAVKRINRLRHEKNGVSAQTYRNTIEREGAKISAAIEKKCKAAFAEHGFDENGELEESTEIQTEKSQNMSIEAIGSAAAELNLKQKVYVSDYELAESVINISADDVLSKRQTETRPSGEAEQPKRVNNSVIHAENNEGKYILNSSDISDALKLLLGFLLCGGQLGKQLVFFTDGAREIHNAITEKFAFANYKIILDWYHLQKKCKEQLSMALNGRQIRNEFLEKLLACLWFGNVDGAVSLLENIDTNKVRNPEFIGKLIGYFERVRNYIPVYALRRELGLRNSSNQGEKSNDLIVATRQKHNGMSWSDDGSLAFASVASVCSNNELQHWLQNGDLAFAFCKHDVA